jgi:hypothetical protein
MSFNNDFEKCFPNNINKIKKALTSISGKHGLNPQNVNNFIHGQLTEMRKKAAQDLIENTIYITLQEVFDIVENLVLNLYSLNDFSKYKNLMMYVGDKKKSFYFISVIAFYFIQKHKLRIPTHFINTLDENVLNECDGDPILIFDDVSYSGSQLATMLGNIYYERIIIQKKTTPNLYIQLVALNTYSLNKLEQVPINRRKIGKKTIDMNFKKSPFQINYLHERLYPTIIEKIGFERYFKMALFFSPFTAFSFMPVVSIYLDHKIADDVSTFTNALMYGPIVPNIDLAIIEEDPYINPEDSNKTVFSKVLEEVNADNKTIVPSKLSFYPLIQNCKNNLIIEKLKFLPPTDDIYKTYLMFVLPIDCFEKKTCPLGNSSVYQIQEFIAKKENQNIINMRKKLTTENCPFAWYKTANLGEQCITQHYSLLKNSKTQKQHSSRKRNSKTQKQHSSRKSNSKTQKQHSSRKSNSKTQKQHSKKQSIKLSKLFQTI